MSSINSVFMQAQLSEAAYADFSDPNKTLLDALKDSGFSDALESKGSVSIDFLELNKSKGNGVRS